MLTSSHPSRHSFHRILALLLLCMLSLAVTQCKPVGGENYATTCNDLEKPARRLTYTYTTFLPDADPYGGRGDFYGKLALDDSKPNLNSDDTWVRGAHKNAGAADEYFRKLRLEGYGIWDGCYGESTQPIMTSVVHQPSFTGWQGKSYSEVYFMDEHVTKAPVVHEWTHGLVGRTINLWSEGGQAGQKYFGQSGALYEALGDIFAYLASGIKVKRDDIHYVTSMNDYVIPSLCNDPKQTEANACKYTNLGIPRQAAYRMIDGSPGKAKTERILFHALNPEYIQPQADFRNFALGVEQACLNIAKNPKLAVGQANGIAFTITPGDCAQVRQAFEEVGMLDSIAAATPVTVAVVPPAENNNLWNGFWGGVGQFFTNTWDSIQHSFSSWWDNLQETLQAQVSGWFQQTGRSIDNFFRQWVQQLCGTALLPAGVAVVLGIQRCRRR